MKNLTGGPNSEAILVELDREITHGLQAAVRKRKVNKDLCIAARKCAGDLKSLALATRKPDLETREIEEYSYLMQPLPPWA